MRRFVIALAAVLVLGLAGPAAAQGTSGTLPGPISTPELERYAGRLQLGQQQRVAALSYHDDYKRQFALLREGEIAEFLGQMRGLQSTGMFPKKEDVAEVFERMDVLNRKIRVLDERFFDRIQPLLTEDQIVALPRVRKARARKRFSSADMSFSGGASTVDLSELFFELDLDAETLGRVDGVVFGYEEAMTRRMAALYDKTAKVMLRMVEEFEKLGLTEASMREPETMRKIAEAAQEIMMNVAGEQMELAEEMKKLNRRTARRIVEMLPIEPRNRFRRQWLDRTYPSIGPNLRWPTERFGRALDDETIDAAKREALAGLLERTDREMDAHARRALDRIEELQQEQATGAFSPEFWQRRQEVMQKLNGEAKEFDLLVDKQVDAILGDGAAAALARGSAGQPAAARSVAAANEPAVPKQPVTTVIGADQYIPAEIGEGQASLWARRLGLDEDHRAVMLALREEYAEQFRTLEPLHFAPLREAVGSLWNKAAEESETQIMQRSADIHRMRVQAMEAIRTTDDAFFDELAEVLYAGETPPALEAIRLGRRRQANSLGHNGGMVTGGSTIDLVAVIQQQRLDDAGRRAIEPSILAFEHAVAPLYETRWRTVLEVHQANDRWTFEARRMQEATDQDPYDYMAWAERYKQIMGDRMTRLIDTETEIGRHQRESLARIVEALDSEPGETVRQAYYRRAVPDVFNDATTVERHLSEALALHDLSRGQRRELEEVAAEYRPEYRRVSDRMIEIALAGTRPWYTDNDMKAWAEYQSTEDELARLRFARSEASGRANTALQRILSEDQLKRIGGLPAME